MPIAIMCRVALVFALALVCVTDVRAQSSTSKTNVLGTSRGPAGGKDLLRAENAAKKLQDRLAVPRKTTSSSGWVHGGGWGTNGTRKAKR